MATQNTTLVSNKNTTGFVRKPLKVQRSPFYGIGEFVWAIYPRSWEYKKNGRAPTLGLVSADDEFTALRAACDVGLATYPETLTATKLEDRRPNAPSTDVVQ